MKDTRLLAVWVVCQFVYDTVLIVGTAYLVFFRGESGWWFLLTMVLVACPTLFKALKQEFALTDDK